MVKTELDVWILWFRFFLLCYLPPAMTNPTYNVVIYLLQFPSVGYFPGGPAVKTSPSNAGSTGSIPGWGAKIPHASWPKYQNIKQEQYCNKFNEDFKKNFQGWPKLILIFWDFPHRNSSTTCPRRAWLFKFLTSIWNLLDSCFSNFNVHLSQQIGRASCRERV